MPRGQQTKKQAKRNLKSAQAYIGSLYYAGGDYYPGESSRSADLNLVQKNKEVLKGLKRARKTSGSIKRKSIKGKKLSVGVDVRYNPSPTGSRTTEDVGGFRVRRTKNAGKRNEKKFGKEFRRVSEGTGPDRYLKKNLKTGKIKDVSRRKFMKTLDKVTKGGGRTRTRKTALGGNKTGPSANKIYVGKDYSAKNFSEYQRLERPALGDETEAQAFGFGGRKAYRKDIKKQKGVIKSQKIAIKQKMKGQHESQKQFLPMDAYRLEKEISPGKYAKMVKPKMLKNKRKNYA